VRVPAVGRFDLTPLAALVSLGVGWMLIATVLGVF